MYSQRGLDANQEAKSSQLLRDTRPLGQRVYEDFFKRPSNLAVYLLTASASGLVVPSLIDVVLILNVLFFLLGVIGHHRLPFRMPIPSKTKDYNDLKPGSRKPKQAQGIYFFGNEKKQNEELWFSNEDMRTHVLIFGSTGSGKTETLVSLAYNALLQSSGFIYVDGKGDNSLFAKVFSMVRYMGREDDMLLINFMTGARDIVGPQEKRLSNTLNPFATGSSSMLSNLVVSMMDASSSSSDGDMWKGRAIAFVEALMKVLVAMRDAGYILLDANVIRNYFALDRLEAMTIDKVFIRDDQYPISIEHMPPVVIEPMKNYLATLPGFQKERKGKQVSQVFEQHGYIIMQLTRVFTSLADTYGHILRTNLAEVDLRDVVLNRRILTVLLPALEKSPDELANLGKVIIASLKSMMAAGLGDEVEGRYQDVVMRKPTNAATPFLCVLDEYGYYAVKGFAVVPAQARSLGFSVIFAGQDLPAFQKASKEEAASIGANTNIKICMKLEDPQETWEFFSKTAGESFVTNVEQFQASQGSITNTYMDAKSAKVEKRARVDLLDLKEQDLGEMHIFFKSKIVRARSFFANPAPVQEMRVNQFLKVDIPKDANLYTLVKGIEDFDQLCNHEGLHGFKEDESQYLHSLSELFQSEPGDDAIQKAVGTVLDFHDQEVSKTTQDATIEVATDTFNLFMKASEAQLEHMNLVNREPTTYTGPLVSKARLNQQLPYLLRLLGSTEADAAHMSEDLLQDIGAATYYYPPSSSLPAVEDLVVATNAVCDDILQLQASQDETDHAN